MEVDTEIIMVNEYTLTFRVSGMQGGFTAIGMREFARMREFVDNMLALIPAQVGDYLHITKNGQIMSDYDRNW